MATAISRYTPGGSTLELSGGGASGGGSDFGSLLGDLMSKAMAARQSREEQARRDARRSQNQARQDAISARNRAERAATQATNDQRALAKGQTAMGVKAPRTDVDRLAEYQAAVQMGKIQPGKTRPGAWGNFYGLPDEWDPTTMSPLMRQMYLPENAYQA
jgi:hypothetical protein